MNLFEELRSLGVNVDEAIERFMGNVELYKRMLVKFPKMIKTSPIQPDFDCNNYDDITEKVHTIKGTSGNLSLTPIYKAYSEILSLLRANQPEQAKKLLNEVLPIQNDIIECIEKYI